MSIFGTPSTGSGGVVGSGGISASSVNTGVGDLIIVAVLTDAAGYGTISISDSAGNTGSYVARTGFRTGSSAGQLQYFYCLAAPNASATNVISIAYSGFSGLVYSDVFVWDFPLTGGTASFDVDAYGAGTSSTPTTASYSTSGSDELVCVSVSNGVAGLSYTAQASPSYTLDSASYFLGVSGAEHILFASAQSGITSSFGQSLSASYVLGAIGFYGTASASSISATITGTSSVSDTLEGAGALESSIAGVATVSADLTGFSYIISTILGTSTVDAALVGSGKLSDSINGLAVVSGTLTGLAVLLAEIYGEAIVSGELRGLTAIACEILGIGIVTATGTATFIPSIVQLTMLRIIRAAQQQGLNITKSTVISTAYSWRMGHGYKAGLTLLPTPQWTIGYVTEQYDTLVAHGLIPPGTVTG